MSIKCPQCGAEFDVTLSATTIIDRRLVEIFDRGVGDVTGSRSTGGLF